MQKERKVCNIIEFQLTYPFNARIFHQLNELKMIIIIIKTIIFFSIS